MLLPHELVGKTNILILYSINLLSIADFTVKAHLNGETHSDCVIVHGCVYH